MRLFIIFLMISLNTWAQLSLIVKPRNEKVKVGQIIPASLVINDLSLLNEINVLKIQSHSLENKAYFFKTSPFVKEKDSNQFISDVEMIFSKEFKNEKSLKLLVDKKEWIVEVRPFEFDGQTNEQAPLDWALTQINFDKLSANNYTKLIIGLFLITIFSFGGFFIIQKMQRKKNEKMKIEKMIKKLESIQKPEEYEKLWLKRDYLKKNYQWMIPALDEFFEVLNQTQFSSNWKEQEMIHLKKKYNQFLEKLRRINVV